jgi:hypothetical protein
MTIRITESQGSGFKVQGSGFRVQVQGFRGSAVQGSVREVRGSGFRTEDMEPRIEPDTPEP